MRHCTWQNRRRFLPRANREKHARQWESEVPAKRYISPVAFRHVALHSTNEYRRTHGERDTRGLSPTSEPTAPVHGLRPRDTYTALRVNVRVALSEDDPGCPPPRPPGCPSGCPPPRPPGRTGRPQPNLQVTDTAGQAHDLRPIGRNALSRVNPARMRRSSAVCPASRPSSLSLAESLLLTRLHQSGRPGLTAIGTGEAAG